MKIAMYVPAWPPGSFANGIVTYAHHVIPALRALGHEVFVLTAIARESSDPYLIDLQKFQTPLPLWNRALFRLSPTDAHFSAAARPLVRAVKGLIIEHGIEILEIEESLGLSYAVSKLGLIPVCVRLHGPWFLNKRFPDARREKLERVGIEAAQAVTSPSKAILDAVVQYYHLNLKETLVFSNPISLSPEPWKLNECDTNSILFVGRFDKIKGGDLAIQAFAKLAEKRRHLKLTFAGQDHEIGGVKLLDYARSNLSSDAFSRLRYAGELHPEQIAHLRMNHFITICPSRHEVLPYSVLEAMSFGCPVVASAVGGIPELVKSGNEGLLFESEDVDGLIAAVQTLLDNPSFAETLGKNALQAVSLLNPEQAAARTLQIYRKAIDQYGLSRAGG